MQSWFYDDIWLAIVAPIGIFGVSGQEILALMLECSNFAQNRLDILALLLKDRTPPVQHFEETFDLDLFVLGGVVEIDEFAYFR